MNKYKVCVYAICKNEEKFISRWVESMREADKIFVLDTGSEDNSVSLLKSLGVIVKQKVIRPWRFDKARNLSLEMVDKDTDICVCTDLDEVLLPGWRKKLEKNWEKDLNCLFYRYNWSLDKKNQPKVSFYLGNIHDRNHYQWTHPVHEVLSFLGENKEITKYTDDIVLNHYPDNTKSRSSYLPLLELSVKEDANDDRNMHYLGREYMYYGRYQESIDTLIHHLSMPSATWRDERCASMRFIGRCYKSLGRYDEAKLWYEKAIQEAPYLRDPYVEKALLYYEVKDYFNMIKYCNKALRIKEKKDTYINEVFSWDYTIYDLLAIGYFEIEDVEKALYYSKLALEMDKDNQRLQDNYSIILDTKKRYTN